MGSSWSFIGSDVLATIPGALRRDGDVNKTWLKRAEKVWNKAGGDGIDLHRSEPGAIILHASQRYFYGNNADDVMRRVFLDAIVPGSSRRNASSRASSRTLEVPVPVLTALILRSGEDLSDARDRASVLADAARLMPFSIKEAESHLFRLFGGHAMSDRDRRRVAVWMAAL